MRDGRAQVVSACGNVHVRQVFGRLGEGDDGQGRVATLEASELTDPRAVRLLPWPKVLGEGDVDSMPLTPLANLQICSLRERAVPELGPTVLVLV